MDNIGRICIAQVVIMITLLALEIGVGAPLIYRGHQLFMLIAISPVITMMLWLFAKGAEFIFCTLRDWITELMYKEN